jgi:hypothetical protein
MSFLTQLGTASLTVMERLIQKYFQKGYVPPFLLAVAC